MGELEHEQFEAIKDEDFHRALNLQEEMKTLRGNVLASVDPRLTTDVRSSLFAPRPRHGKNNIGKHGDLPYVPMLLRCKMSVQPLQVQTNASIKEWQLLWRIQEDFQVNDSNTTADIHRPKNLFDKEDSKITTPKLFVPIGRIPPVMKIRLRNSK